MATWEEVRLHPLWITCSGLRVSSPQCLCTSSSQDFLFSALPSSHLPPAPPAMLGLNKLPMNRNRVSKSIGRTAGCVGVGGEGV